MNQIRHFRELRKISQTELAKKCHVPQTWISRTERDGKTPRKEGTRIALCRALRVSMEDLFPEADGAELGEPLAPKHRLFKSSRYLDRQPAKAGAAAKPEPIPMTRAICRWCGFKYDVDNEVKITVGENTIKTYGHLSCLAEDVNSGGLELKKRGLVR
jgi:transcriptional regulator with XRE-family HTH domain